MTSTILYSFPHFLKCSNHSFKPLLSCINVTCCRYYSITDDDKVVKKVSQKGVNEENSMKDHNKETESDKLQSESDKLQSESDKINSNEAAKKKLFELLSEIKVVSEVSNRRINSNLNLARPLSRDERKKHLCDDKNEASTPVEKVKLAVKAVASTIKGDPGKIELELNEKLNSINISKESLDMKETEKGSKISPDCLIGEEEGKTIMSSVKDVASTVCVDSKPIQSELAKRLLYLATEEKTPEDQLKIMQNLYEGLKIDVKPAKEKSTNRIQNQSDAAYRPYQPYRTSEQRKVNLFSSPPLNIFKLDERKRKDEKKNLLWLSLQEKELKMMVQFAPKNAFEEMIRWTEQGKHWKFPIDNECDMGIEETTGFHEHVFLDHHLHGFPTKGPVRHFMELVVLGLSKNPHITADRKIENIDWFRQYFKDKEGILEDCGILNLK